MSSIVLDASLIVALLIGDEVEPDTTASLADIEESDAIVPQLWHSEIRNALLIAERRARITSNQISQRLLYLSTLPIHTDQEPNLDVAMTLARTHNLTFYNALYLELAIRRNAQLANLDVSLARAATAEGLSEPSRE
ncbi:MAG: type II toxin-antitoxin system VapC family toxin [Chloroflexi bacterium]|nr:type II toxin-antitoxin system VapC family toxin [Chloroflexota bacterium]